MQKIISCRVTDEYVSGTGAVVGAVGSHDDAALELSFSEIWNGTTKRIVWFDALGQNPTLTVLTVDLLVPGEDEVYRVPIPGEAKGVAGDMLMSIRGVVIGADGKEEKAVVSATGTFVVLDSVWDENASESEDITPSQAEQLQSEVDSIKTDISKAVHGIDEIGEALVEAQGYANSANTAMASAETAKNEAENYATTARDYASTAVQYSNQAGTYASNAEAAIKKTPKISANGTWVLWDATTNAYVDTGLRAQGISGVYVGSGEMPEGYNVQIDPDGEVYLPYYTPVVTQPTNDTLQFDFVPSDENLPDVESVAVTLPGGGGSGFPYEIGHGLKVVGNALEVDTVSDFDGDNTLPITAAAVQATVGNIELILATI